MLSCSVLLAAQKQKSGPCKKCQEEAKQLAEKMKSASITLKSAIDAGVAERQFGVVPGFPPARE